MAFGEADPSEQRGGAVSHQTSVPGKVTFSRRELDRILGLYGRMVAAGEWRDYAIDFLRARRFAHAFVIKYHNEARFRPTARRVRLG